MEKKDILRLDLPERTAPPGDSFLHDPREVERWISGLPMANIGETSRQIFKTLVEINRVNIPGLARIKVSELFRRPIGYITSNLKKYYFDSAFPLSAKNRKIAVLNRELYIELAIGYKIVIQEMLSGEARKLDRKVLVIAIQRAMSTLLNVLYQSAVVYDPFPANVWRELHRLYAFAEFNQLHEIPVKDQQKNTTHGSIKESYIQALLFAVISPYRLRPREIEQCYQQLDTWGRFCSLGVPEQFTSSPTLFLSRLNTNAPPIHIELQDLPIDKHCRQLNTGQLVATLQDQINDVENGNGQEDPLDSGSRMEGQLLERLVQVLSAVQKRRYVRTNLNFELNIAVGLADIHALLVTPPSTPEEDGVPEPKEGEIDWFEPKERKPLINSPTYVLEGASAFQLDTLEGNEPETIIATGIQGLEGGDDPMPVWASSRNGETPEPFSCTTDNESAWGYCIVWPSPNTPKIRVGEVLGILLSSNEVNGYRIGLSRWLRNIPGDSLQVGLEIIGLGSIAVQIRKADAAAGSNSHTEKGIVLPEISDQGRKASLITASLPFSSGDRLIVESSGGTQEIRLTRLLESTGAFSQFQFNYTKHRILDGNEAGGDTGTDFDNLWSAI